MSSKQAISLDVWEGFGNDPQALDTAGELTSHQQYFDSPVLKIKSTNSFRTLMGGRIIHEPE